jgi:hypothetical protein
MRQERISPLVFRTAYELLLARQQKQLATTARQRRDKHGEFRLMLSLTAIGMFGSFLLLFFCTLLSIKWYHQSFNLLRKLRNLGFGNRTMLIGVERNSDKCSLSNAKIITMVISCFLHAPSSLRGILTKK